MSGHVLSFRERERRSEEGTEKNGGTRTDGPSSLTASGLTQTVESRTSPALTLPRSSFQEPKPRKVSKELNEECTDGPTGKTHRQIEYLY